MARTRMGLIGPSAAYAGFSPKVETVVEAIGAVSANGVAAYLGGSVTTSLFGSHVTTSALGGSVTTPTLGGSVE